MSTYPLVPLGQICVVNPRKKGAGNSNKDMVVSFVPMSAVDERFGTITVRENRPLSEVSRGFTAFENGDVLFAKITPCMENGKVALARNLANGVGRGSTEFLVLRPGNRVLSEYVYHFVRQPRFREAARQNFTGTAGQKRVPKSFMENALVALPPLCEQRKIVGVLNRAACIERLRTQASDRLREFIPALFIKMFGDPVENPMGWEQQQLGNLGEVQGGLQVSRKRAVHPLEKPYLRVANVLRDQLVLSEIKSIRLTEQEFGRVRLQPGDLLVVEEHGNAAEIGRAAIWDDSVKHCVHQNHLIRVRPGHSLIIPEFACAYLNSSSGRQHLLRSGKTTSGLNTITTSDVKGCTMFVPPLALQRRYADIVESVRKVIATAEFGSQTVSVANATLMANLLGNYT